MRKRTPKTRFAVKKTPQRVQQTVRTGVSLDFGLRHGAELEAMESILGITTAAEPGAAVKHTVDLDTCAGCAQLALRDRDVLTAEYNRLRELQSTLFEVVRHDEM